MKKNLLKYLNILEMKKMANNRSKKDISHAESVRLSHEYMIAKNGEGQKMIGNLVIKKIERKDKKERKAKK